MEWNRFERWHQQSINPVVIDRAGLIVARDVEDVAGQKQHKFL